MKKLFAAFAALSLAGSSLSGCTQALQVAEGISTHGETVTLSATKALTIAADAYATVANLVATRVERGSFTDDQLRMIRTINQQATKLIDGSAAGLTVAERAANIVLVTTQLRSILEN